MSKKKILFNKKAFEKAAKEAAELERKAGVTPIAGKTKALK